jgi:uncharacterized membrane protein
MAGQMNDRIQEIESGLPPALDAFRLLGVILVPLHKACFRRKPE